MPGSERTPSWDTEGLTDLQPGQGFRTKDSRWNAPQGSPPQLLQRFPEVTNVLWSGHPSWYRASDIS
eukprot:5319635-Pyramimonas_sp.AAC.1